jgi:predicted dehydrogenase
MNRLRIGVIGFGFMGKMHAAIFNQLPQTELVAVVDVDPSRFEDSTFQGVNFYTDFRDLLQRKDIDAVSICVSDAAHFQPAIQSAQAGKHIFLEKPIALNLDEARLIVQQAAQNGVKLMIGFLLRFDPRYAKVKDLIEQGNIGDVVHIHARRNSPKSEGPVRYKGSTPLLFHVTIHDLDLILWYLQDAVKTVYAQAVSKALKDNKMDDTVFAILRFQNDTLVNLESSWALPEGSATKLDAYMEILGTRGMAKVECGFSGLWYCDSQGTSFPDTMHWPRVRDQQMGDLREELMHFANCILEDTPPLVTGEDGLRSLELAWAIQQSLDSNQILTLSESASPSPVV